MGGVPWLSGRQAVALVLALAFLELASVLYFFGVAISPATGYAVGQVLSTVQNELPSNYYFNADAALEVFDGKPAFRLSLGENMVMSGKASDLNGYGELSASTCVWAANAFSSTTAVSFSGCNATDCNYTCTLTVSSSTPPGTYNITSNIIDTSNAQSQLSQLVYLFEFTQSNRGEGSSGRGRDILILRPYVPSPTPTTQPTATAAASPAPTLEPTLKEFRLSLAAPDFINKCEVKEVEAIVENNNPSQKSVVLDFEGKSIEMDLQPFEVRSVFFRIKAPKEKGENTYALHAKLYRNGIAIEEKQKVVKLLWKGLDVCVTQAPSSEFGFIAGKNSVARVGLEIATDYSPSTLEIEVFKGESHAFIDLQDTPDGYYESSFKVFEKGEYEFSVRARKGFETVEEKFEKAQIG
ncbi:MAG: hypothetical protein QXR53_03980 [Candidatus Norongarragalinales archaeon]